jgi:hypothetical protein
MENRHCDSSDLEQPNPIGVARTRGLEAPEAMDKYFSSSLCVTVLLSTSAHDHGRSWDRVRASLALWFASSGSFTDV